MIAHCYWHLARLAARRGWHQTHTWAECRWRARVFRRFEKEFKRRTRGAP